MLSYLQISAELRINPIAYLLVNFAEERLHDSVVVLGAKFTVYLGGGADLI